MYWQFERRFALASIKLAFCRCACPGSGDPGKQALPNEAAPYPQKGEVNRSKAAKHKFLFIFSIQRGGERSEGGPRRTSCLAAGVCQGPGYITI